MYRLCYNCVISHYLCGSHSVFACLPSNVSEPHTPTAFELSLTFRYFVRWVIARRLHNSHKLDIGSILKLDEIALQFLIPLKTSCSFRFHNVTFLGFELWVSTALLVFPLLQNICWWFFVSCFHMLQSLMLKSFNSFPQVFLNDPLKEPRFGSASRALPGSVNVSLCFHSYRFGPDPQPSTSQGSLRKDPQYRQYWMWLRRLLSIGPMVSHYSQKWQGRVSGLGDQRQPLWSWGQCGQGTIQIQQGDQQLLRTTYHRCSREGHWDLFLYS